MRSRAASCEQLVVEQRRGTRAQSALSLTTAIAASITDSGEMPSRSGVEAEHQPVAQRRQRGSADVVEGQVGAARRAAPRRGRRGISACGAARARAEPDVVASTSAGASGRPGCSAITQAARVVEHVRGGGHARASALMRSSVAASATGGGLRLGARRSCGDDRGQLVDGRDSRSAACSRKRSSCASGSG